MLATDKTAAPRRSEPLQSLLPDTPHVSMRAAIIWIAYGDAKPPDNLKGNTLWLSREQPIEAARSSLWSELSNGALDASAIGPDGAPAIIGRHEWQFLFGRSMILLSMNGGLSMSAPRDGLYVDTASARLAAGSPRFTKVTVPRIKVLEIWPRRAAITPAAPGRPSIMKNIESQLDIWIAGGFPILSAAMKKYGQGGQKTLIAIARARAVGNRRGAESHLR